MSTEKSLVGNYAKAPLVLAAICVCSAGIIGGLHFVAEWYSETHKSTEAPKEIQKLNPSAQFVEVEGFQPVSSTGDDTKVTIESVYEMQENGSRTGYAYSVNCGKPVKTEVTFTVAFQGDVSESTVNDLRPIAINVLQGGDAGYDGNTISYASAIVAGTKQFNDKSDIVSGGTKSQRFLRDGLNAARNDYLARYNGSTPTPGPTDETLALIQRMYPGIEEYSEDENFKAISFSSDHDGTGEIVKRYRAENEGKVVFFYEGQGKVEINPYGKDESEKYGEIDILVAYDADVTSSNLKQINPSKSAVISSSFSYSQWEGYLSDLEAGNKDLDSDADVSTGATRSSVLLQTMMIRMRKDYHTTRLAEIKAGVGTAVTAVFPSNKGYAEDTTFAAVSQEDYQISKRYNITFEDETRAAMYLGTASASIEADGSVSKISLYVGFSGSEEASVAFAGYSEVSSSGFDQWKSYLDEIKAGNKSLDSDADVSTGATLSTTAVRKMILGMRSDYIASIAK